MFSMIRKYKFQNAEFREYIRNLCYYIPPKRTHKNIKKYFIYNSSIKTTLAFNSNYKPQIGTIRNTDLTIIKINGQERIKGCVNING